MKRVPVFVYVVSAVLLVAALIVGCSERTVGPDGDEGLVLKTRFTSSQFLAQIEWVRLTVYGPDMDTIVVSSIEPIGSEGESTDSIAFDGQRIFVRVDVPAGRDRVFILEAFDASSVLYRAVRVATILPGEVSIVDLALDPVVPMVRLSPRRVEVGGGQVFALDLELANLPGVAGVAVELDPADAAITPIVVERHPTQAPTVATTGTLVFDNEHYMAVAVDTARGPLVDSRGNGKAATVYFSAPAGVSNLVDTAIGYVYVYQFALLDTAGNEMPTEGVVTDDATIYMSIDDDRVITFPDPELLGEIRRILNQPSGDILLSQGLTIRTLDFEEGGVASWTGMENLANLTTARIGYNSAPDLSPLSGLQRLQILSARGMNLSSLAPLADLRSLMSLNLRENNVSDLGPLAGLTQLRELVLSFNPVQDISALSDMTYLLRLEMWDAQVANLAPLASLSNLQDLQMSQDSALTDIGPLAGLRDLNLLNLTDCANISTIYPLVQNTGISGSADTVYLYGLDVLVESGTERGYVDSLRQRGAIVFYDEPGK